MGRIHRGDRIALEISFPVGHQLGQSKIENLGVPAPRDEDIRRLDVAMDDSLGMRRIERIRNLHAEIEHLLDRQRFIFDPVLQRLAIEKFHGDERLAIYFVHVVNRADIGMIQSGGRACFPSKSFERLAIRGKIFRQEFQRNEAAELRIFGLEHDAHTAATDFFNHAVVRDGFSDHEREERGVMLVPWSRQVNAPRQGRSILASRFIRAGRLKARLTRSSDGSPNSSEARIAGRPQSIQQKRTADAHDESTYSE